MVLDSCHVSRPRYGSSFPSTKWGGRDRVGSVRVASDPSSETMFIKKMVELLSMDSAFFSCSVMV